MATTPACPCTTVPHHPTRHPGHSCGWWGARFGRGDVQLVSVDLERGGEEHDLVDLRDLRERRLLVRHERGIGCAAGPLANRPLRFMRSIPAAMTANVDIRNWDALPNSNPKPPPKKGKGGGERAVLFRGTPSCVALKTRVDERVHCANQHRVDSGDHQLAHSTRWLEQHRMRRARMSHLWRCGWAPFSSSAALAQHGEEEPNINSSGGTQNARIRTNTM